MRFARPDLLWLLLAVPAIGAVLLFAAARRRRDLRRFAGGDGYVERFTTESSAHRRATKGLLVIAGLTLGILAIARPQWGAKLEPVTRRGIDVVLVVDTSASMAAQDAAPDRLGQARRTAMSLLDRLGGDRVALVSFAGRASLLCPLTLDHGAIRLFLDALDFDSAPIPGTSLSDGIEAAARALGAPAAEEIRGRAVVVLSDGEDHESGLEASRAALRKVGAVAYALGVGSPQGAPIPARDAGAREAGYKKDKEGKLVTTRLDESTLAKLAIDSGGKYFRATSTEGELDEVARALSGMDATATSTVLRTKYEERFQIPLAVALLLIASEALVGERRRSATEGR